MREEKLQEISLRIKHDLVPNIRRYKTFLCALFKNLTRTIRDAVRNFTHVNCDCECK